MAKCTKCGKKGMFLKVNVWGLCSECESIHNRQEAAEAAEKKLLKQKRNCRILSEEQKTQMHSTKTPKHMQKIEPMKNCPNLLGV